MGDPFNAEREAESLVRETEACDCGGLPGCMVTAAVTEALRRAHAAGLDAAAEECEPVRRMYASSGRDAGIASGAVKCMDRIRSLAKKTRGKP